MPLIDQLLDALLEREGSDLHLITDQPAKIRYHGKLTALTDEIITNKNIEEMLNEICPPLKWDYFMKNKELDFAYEMKGKARFRTNYFFNYNGMAAVFHTIPIVPPAFDDLNLPDTLKVICDSKSGFFCISGPTGSGKSTTLAAMINYININYSKHIITLEKPIEFIHKNKESIIVYREIGNHCKSYSKALKNIIKLDADVILIGDISNIETIDLALTCAAMGILVLTSINTCTTSLTIKKIIDSFPESKQQQIKTMLAESIIGMTSQVLCKTSDATGRIPANEILLWTEGLPNAIRESQLSSIQTIIDSNKGIGMQSLNNSLKSLLNEELITPEEAYAKAINKKEFSELTKDN